MLDDVVDFLRQRDVLHRDRPPRVLFPFWLQLFASFLGIIAILALGLLRFIWPEVERRVITESRAFITMSGATLGADLVDLSVLYDDSRLDVAGRREDRTLIDFQRVHSGEALAARPKPSSTTTTDPAETDKMAETDSTTEGNPPPAATPPPLQPPPRSEAAPPSINSFFYEDYRLDFSIIVPTGTGWVRWLSSDPELVGKPIAYGNYVESYARNRAGWDNFIDDSGRFSLFNEDDPEAIAEIARQRSQAASPPRLGVNVAQDPIISVRPLGARIDPLRLPARASELGVDLSRAMFVAEFPRDRNVRPTFLLKAVFVGVISIASIFTLLLAIFITWRINRPISKLYRAMLGISQGDLSLRVSGIAASNELGRLAWQFNTMMNEFQTSRRLTSEVNVASRIQRELIPPPPGNITRLDIACWYATSSMVGGDYYDFVQRDRSLFVIIGDAVGHGIDSGLIMASARAMVRALLERTSDPAEVLSGLNRLLSRDFSQGNFLTCAVARIDLDTLTVFFASAGHEPGVHMSGRLGSQLGSHRLLKSTGPPLGLFPDHAYRTAPPFTLAAGDLLVVCTDGIRECHDPANNLFGMDRFVQTLGAPAKSSAETIANVQGALARHCAGRPIVDDVSLVVLRAVE